MAFTNSAIYFETGNPDLSLCDGVGRIIPF